MDCHAVPLEERLLDKLIKAGVFEPETPLDKASGTIERHVKASEGLETYLVLQAYSEETSADGSNSRASRRRQAGSRARARLQNLSHDDAEKENRQVLTDGTQSGEAMASRLRGMTMLAAMVTMCSLSHPSAAEQVGPAPSLEELLAQENRNAEQGVQLSDVPLPETIADWGAPPTDAARAKASIDQIRQELLGELPDTADRANPSDADATRATEIFRQAQKFIETGRASAAVAALRQSLRLDPSSVQAWRSLGLLLDQQQNPIAAKAAFAEAIALGDREPLTLIRYGLLASRFREDPLAATALLTALTNSDQAADEGALLLTRTTLAEVLLRLGYVSESVRAFEVLLDLPPTFEPETEFRSEINEVYRDRRRSLLRASEAAHSIGEIGLSNRFLEAAAALPGPTNTRELTVRCYMLLRVGRPVAAASLVAAHVARSTPEAEDDRPAPIRRNALGLRSGDRSGLEKLLRNDPASRAGHRPAEVRPRVRRARAEPGRTDGLAAGSPHSVPARLWCSHRTRPLR